MQNFIFFIFFSLKFWQKIKLFTYLNF
jgi:hypothetical protein